MKCEKVFGRRFCKTKGLLLFIFLNFEGDGALRARSILYL